MTPLMDQASLLGTYEDHNDDCENDDGRDEIESHQEEGDNEDGHERNAQRLQRVLPHRQVLLVEDVEDRVGEHFDLLREKKNINIDFELSTLEEKGRIFDIYF